MFYCLDSSSTSLLHSSILYLVVVYTFIVIVGIGSVPDELFFVSGRGKLIFSFELVLYYVSVHINVKEESGKFYLPPFLSRIGQH